MAKKKRKQARRNKLLSAAGKTLGSAGKFFLKLVPAVLLVLLVLFGFSKVRDVLYADPALDIREIRILPPNVLPAALKSELEKKWLGKNIFTADVGSVAHFLAQAPIVLRAETVKNFPSTLTVRIVQRIPFARIQFTRDGQTAIISEDGMILNFEDDEDKPFNGPRLEAFETSWKKPVKGAAMAPKGFTQAVQFDQGFKSHPLADRETITRLNLDDLGNLTVTLGKGPDIKLGRRPVEMLKLLQKISPFLEPSERTKIQYVDLQFEDVIVKRKGKS